MLGATRSGKAGLGSGWRYTAAAAAVATAGAHLLVTEDTWHEAGYLGALFVAVEAACLLLATALCLRDTRVVWRSVGATGAVAICAYAYSRVVGLPGIRDDVGHWTEPLGLAAIGAELVMCLLALRVLRKRPDAAEVRRHAGQRRSVFTGVVALQLGVAGVFSAAYAQGASTPAVPGHEMATAGNAYWNQVGGAAFHPTGTVRTYFLESDEVVWNYAPTGRNQITGRPFDAVADTYVTSGPGRIGSKYLKCLYRGYTDGTFSTLAARPASEAYLGFTGPVIRAEVGDTIKVVFRNTCSIPTSVHPHGVFYEKSSEGAPYADGTSGSDKADDAVPTGGRHVYTWLVPDRAGPGPHDGSSVMWMYHSHTDEIGDTYAGLMGFMAITARGQARPDGSPKDVDREVFELFSVMNENNSPYLEQNVRRFAKPPAPSADDEGFEESNLMHSINGYVFGNQPMLTVRKGERVRWYVMSMGTEVDLHTPHWHGNDVVVGGMRMDVVSLLPAGMIVADMVPDNAGIWLFHCHVNDHLTAGMMTRYQVVA